MSSICILKLLNGEEIVGQLVTETPDKILLDRPLMVETSMNPIDGTTSVILSSYIPFAKIDQPCTFYRQHVVQCLPVKAEVERYYTNSLIYHNKHIETNIEKVLESTNKVMEQVIEKNTAVTDTSFIHKNISKAIH